VYRDGVLLVVTVTCILPACVCYRAKFIPSRVWSVTVWEPARHRLCRTPSFVEFIPSLQQVATSWTGCDTSSSAADRGTSLTVPQELPGTGRQCDRCHHLAPVSYTLLWFSHNKDTWTGGYAWINARHACHQWCMLYRTTSESDGMWVLHTRLQMVYFVT
jgi:hypothetical protein